MKINIIGGGLGSQELLTKIAIEELKKADLVLTCDRLGDRLSHLNPNIQTVSISAMSEKLEELKNTNQNIAILASGDVGFYSIANTLIKKHPNLNFNLLNGISSFQYISAYLKIPYQDMKLVSFHGKDASPVPYVAYNKKTFMLTGGKWKAHDIITTLIKAGLNEVIVTVGENLSAENERIITGKITDLTNYTFADLAVVVIQNDKAVDVNEEIPDDAFIRGKSPMTKEGVRSILLTKLNIKPDDVIYDVGAGTGSCSIAIARRANEGSVYAIEKVDYGVELIKENKAKFGAYNVEVIHDSAPEGLENLPAPTKVFIGGSTGNMDQILDAVYAKNPKAMVVVTAVTLETLAESVSEFKKRNISSEVMCVNVASAAKLGNYNLMKAENPVYIIKAV